MAILENGLESIELGATAWREILNYNFAKLLTKEQILALVQQGGANTDGSVPSYLTKQEANSLYALKSELGNADLSGYLTLAAADSKYLSKLEANSFLTQQSADNYYAKKTELNGRVKDWVGITQDDLTNIFNNGACSVNEKGFLTFADAQGDQAFLFSQDIKKIRVYYDSTVVEALIRVIYKENGDSISLHTTDSSPGSKLALDGSQYESLTYLLLASMEGCFYEVEILDDNMLLITTYWGKNLLKTTEPLRLGICVRLIDNSDLTVRNLRVQKWA
ncbi:MAG: hypothetical protein SPJ69_04365 [Campylobacter sp.]|uniref:hypothetical protein n=1 Tax=Campylobacter sp. TaxID=205 RepID=UPI002973F881|nr:hypothetical protein [Campylobacter sp.]MDD7599165.1 hypothetical protein [Campylobacteraceae bacterium]MDY5887535.1 hypothetical protein [Campylobacter sp.]